MLKGDMQARTRALALLLSIGAVSALIVVSKPSLAQTTVPSGSPTQAPGTAVNVGVPDTTLTVGGCASPNAFVQFFDNSIPVGTVIADSAGRFNKTITVENADAGLHNIKLFYDDVNGRTSSIVTRNISLSAQSNTVFNLLLPTTIEHSPEPVRIGSYMIFRGTTCPLALVNVVINNNFTLAAQADLRGNWYVIANTSGFYPGAHIYEALSDLGSDISERTSKYQFTTAGEGSGFDGQVPLLVPPQIIEPRDLFLSSTRNVTFRGIGPTNSQIEIYVDDALRGSVFTNPLGEWSFVLTMQEPQHTIKARACFQNRCSEFSSSVRVQFAGSLDDCSLDFSLSNYRYNGIVQNDGIDLQFSSISGRPSYAVLIDWGDAIIEHMTLLNDERVKIHHVFNGSGQFNGTVTVQDSNGCKTTQYVSAYVGPDSATDWRMIAAVVLAPLVFYSSWIANDFRRDPTRHPRLLKAIQALRSVKSEGPPQP